MNPVIHFEILVDDLDRAQAFYENVLGWKLQSWPDGPPYRLCTTHAPGSPGIDGALMERQFDQPVINTVGVADLAAALAAVKANGGAHVLGPNTIPGIGEHAYVRDSEGNILGLLQPL